ncbi:hypothetical protein TNCV_2216111 [Trichonephila clavipes]|nr:hypothetical protein TNCV_2216111 [Trichonephila clavipes]
MFFLDFFTPITSFFRHQRFFFWEFFGNRESAGICSGIWVWRTLNPVSGKKSIFCMAIRFVFMLWSESLRLDERQGFEAWILTSRRILLLKSERKIESSYWLLESEDNGSEKMNCPGGGVSVRGVLTDVQ